MPINSFIQTPLGEDSAIASSEWRTAQGAIVALIMERGNASVWSISWDTKLLTALYRHSLLETHLLHSRSNNGDGISR
ncbi:unnamed protein product [Camellia sinensis]